MARRKAGKKAPVDEENVLIIEGEEEEQEEEEDNAEDEPYVPPTPGSKKPKGMRQTAKEKEAMADDTGRSGERAGTGKGKAGASKKVKGQAGKDEESDEQDQGSPSKIPADERGLPSVIPPDNPPAGRRGPPPDSDMLNWTGTIHKKKEGDVEKEKPKFVAWYKRMYKKQAPWHIDELCRRGIDPKALPQKSGQFKNASKLRILNSDWEPPSEPWPAPLDTPSREEKTPKKKGKKSDLTAVNKKDKSTSPSDEAEQPNEGGDAMDPNNGPPEEAADPPAHGNKASEGDDRHSEAPKHHYPTAGGGGDPDGGGSSDDSSNNSDDRHHNWNGGGPAGRRGARRTPPRKTVPDKNNVVEGQGSVPTDSNWKCQHQPRKPMRTNRHRWRIPNYPRGHVPDNNEFMEWYADPFRGLRGSADEVNVRDYDWRAVRGQLLEFGRWGWQDGRLVDEMRQRKLDPYTSGWTDLKNEVYPEIPLRFFLDLSHKKDRYGKPWPSDVTKGHFKAINMTLCLLNYEIESMVMRFGGWLLPVLGDRIAQLQGQQHELDGGLKGNDVSRGHKTPRQDLDNTDKASETQSDADDSSDSDGFDYGGSSDDNSNDDDDHDHVNNHDAMDVHGKPDEFGDRNDGDGDPVSNEDSAGQCSNNYNANTDLSRQDGQADGHELEANNHLHDVKRDNNADELVSTAPAQVHVMMSDQQEQDSPSQQHEEGYRLVPGAEDWNHELELFKEKLLRNDNDKRPQVTLRLGSGSPKPETTSGTSEPECGPPENLLCEGEVFLLNYYEGEATEEVRGWPFHKEGSSKTDYPLGCFTYNGEERDTWTKHYLTPQQIDYVYTYNVGWRPQDKWIKFPSKHRDRVKLVIEFAENFGGPAVEPPQVPKKQVLQYAPPRPDSEEEDEWKLLVEEEQRVMKEKRKAREMLQNFQAAEAELETTKKNDKKRPWDGADSEGSRKSNKKTKQSLAADLDPKEQARLGAAREALIANTGFVEDTNPRSRSGRRNNALADSDDSDLPDGSSDGEGPEDSFKIAIHAAQQQAQGSEEEEESEEE